jgi:D-aspartate ligase
MKSGGLSFSENGTTGPKKPTQEVAGGLVIGGDYQGLGIVRSLGRLGVPVGIVDDEVSVARFSCYTNFCERIPSLKDPAETSQFLLRLAERRGLRGWVLYPTRDETVAALSEHRNELCEFYRVPTPNVQTTRWFWDKRNTYELALRSGISIPATWYPGDARALGQMEWHFPVALKPAIKEHLIYATGVKAWRADNLGQLEELFKRASRFMPPGEIMIQDVVPGGGDRQYSYCCLFKEGRAMASLVTRRLRQHPLQFGRASTYVESAEVSCLEEMSERFLRAAGYYGLAELEYKYDCRDGQYKLLDANARTWGYNSIGRSAGVDFPALLFIDQLKHEIPISRGKAGVRWIRVLTDTPTAVIALLKRELKWSEYFRSLHDVSEEAVFSRDDLLPGIVELALIPYLAAKRGF